LGHIKGVAPVKAVYQFSSSTIPHRLGHPIVAERLGANFFDPLPSKKHHPCV